MIRSGILNRTSGLTRSLNDASLLNINKENIRFPADFASRIIYTLSDILVDLWLNKCGFKVQIKHTIIPEQHSAIKSVIQRFFKEKINKQYQCEKSWNRDIWTWLKGDVWWCVKFVVFFFSHKLNFCFYGVARSSRSSVNQMRLTRCTWLLLLDPHFIFRNQFFCLFL